MIERLPIFALLVACAGGGGPAYPKQPAAAVSSWASSACQCQTTACGNRLLDDARFYLIPHVRDSKQSISRRDKQQMGQDAGRGGTCLINVGVSRLKLDQLKDELEAIAKKE